jgi:hypothetical protein
MWDLLEVRCLEYKTVVVCTANVSSVAELALPCTACVCQHILWNRPKKPLNQALVLVMHADLKVVPSPRASPASHINMKASPARRCAPSSISVSHT